MIIRQILFQPHTWWPIAPSISAYLRLQQQLPSTALSQGVASVIKFLQTWSLLQWSLDPSYLGSWSTVWQKAFGLVDAWWNYLQTDIAMFVRHWMQSVSRAFRHWRNRHDNQSSDTGNESSVFINTVIVCNIVVEFHRGASVSTSPACAWLPRRSSNWFFLGKRRGLFWVLSRP